MGTNTNKIKLSPRLRWGVGRDIHRVNFFKITGAIFLFASVALTFRAGYLLLSGDENGREPIPKVLGAVDTNDTQQAFTEHKVKKGDTLFTISKEYSIEWTALATLNGLKAPFNLQVGQTVKIPKQ